jgi:hypothetical protein
MVTYFIHFCLPAYLVYSADEAKAKDLKKLSACYSGTSKRSLKVI